MRDIFRFVGHEVRSPVNTTRSAIMATLDLPGEGLEPRARDLLGLARGRLDQATEMVKDLASLAGTGVLRPDRSVRDPGVTAAS